MKNCNRPPCTFGWALTLPLLLFVGFWSPKSLFGVSAPPPPLPPLPLCPFGGDATFVVDSLFVRSALLLIELANELVVPVAVAVGGVGGGVDVVDGLMVKLLKFVKF